MNKRYRRTVIAGNWKMNKTPTEARELITEIIRKNPKNRALDIVLCVPFVDISAAKKLLKGTRISLGAQNMHHEESGAYTGEISVSMLKDAGVKYVVLGHSERRQYFGETDELVGKKVKLALANDLRPILCVGEVLEQRDLGIHLDIISTQVKAALHGIDPAELKKVIIAYEPVWAIGTGRTASPEQAAEVCGHIRNVVRHLHNARIARGMTIQYGGSMNAKNAEDLLGQVDIDGGLIGGAALKADDFTAIIQAGEKLLKKEEQA